MEYEVVNDKGSSVSVASPTVIKVIGCGGGGSNAVNRMIEANFKNVEFIALNTDLLALGKSSAPKRLAIGQKLTQGLGAGGDPDIGEKAAEEDKEAIQNILKGANMVFITAGMGGGTGTGSAPVVARIAKEIGALAVGIVTTPFEWEGEMRMEHAREGLKKLREAVDSIIVIPNAKICEVFDGESKQMNFKQQFLAADDLLRQSIEGMSTIITDYGTPNIDFADVRAAMRGQGTALFGIGNASGENRAVDAAQRAINNPLLEDTKIDGAKHFLVNVRASSDFNLNELKEISNIVTASACPGYDLKPGIVIDESMGDSISVTVIATGFNDQTKNKIEEPVIIEPSESEKKDPNVFNSDDYDKLFHNPLKDNTESVGFDEANDNFSFNDGFDNEKKPVDELEAEKPVYNPSAFGSFATKADVTDSSQSALQRKRAREARERNLSSTINFGRR